MRLFLENYAKKVFGIILCGFLRDKIALNKSGSSEPAEEITAFVAIFERKKFVPEFSGQKRKMQP